MWVPVLVPMLHPVRWVGQRRLERSKCKATSLRPCNHRFTTSGFFPIASAPVTALMSPSPELLWNQLCLRFSCTEESRATHGGYAKWPMERRRPWHGVASMNNS